MLNYLKAMRPHQWAKNLLIFSPWFFAQKWSDKTALLRCLVGFIVFSLLASGVYLLNDIKDLKYDKTHPEKKSRPLASGSINKKTSTYLALLLISFSLSVTYFLGVKSFYIEILYLILNLAYSLKLKQIPYLDLLLLSTFYLIRVYYGSGIATIKVSHTFFLFILFIFYSLASAKRYSELAVTKEDKISNRGYKKKSLTVLKLSGLFSGYTSVALFIFYLFNPATYRLYPHKLIFDLISPILLFWMTNIWKDTLSGKLHSDPVIHAISDKKSLLTLILILSMLTYSSGLLL